jgi:cell wall-associated NlpC family hydrolase
LYARANSIPEMPFSLSKLIGISFVITVLVLSGCSTSPKQPAATTKASALFAKNTNHGPIQRQLSRHFEFWKQTPYKLGGTSKRGIDCSGFVQVTYQEIFDKNLPRSTALQVKAGHNVSRNNLKLGDLVFFRTGRRQRHVGIYVGNNRFMHASTSRGVMLSKLNSPYWVKHYWKARRILSI